MLNTVDALAKGKWNVHLLEDGSLLITATFKRRRNLEFTLGRTETVRDKLYLPIYVIHMINLLRDRNRGICGMWIGGKYLGEVIRV